MNRPDAYLSILTKILTANEDYEIQFITEGMIDILDGEDEKEKNDIERMILTAASIRQEYIYAEWLKSKLIHPEPPKPTLFFSNILSINVQCKAGVYFFWDENDRIIYVGKSKNLNKRLTKNHEKIKEDDMIRVSYLFFPEKDISYVESYYIGMYKPARNFPSSSRKDHGRPR
jgi:hypothetical protein